MDPITTSIIASAVYELLKHGTLVTAASLKSRLANWLQNDADAVSLEKAINELELNDEMSEKAINKQLEQSAALGNLIQQINAKAVQNSTSNITTVNQTHSGSGDNVAGSKFVN